MLCLVLLPRFQWINLGHQEFQGNGRVALWYRAKISRLNNIMALLLRHGLVGPQSCCIGTLTTCWIRASSTAKMVFLWSKEKAHESAPFSQAHMPYNNWVGIFVLLSKTYSGFCRRMMSVLGHCYCFFVLHFLGWTLLGGLRHGGGVLHCCCFPNFGKHQDGGGSSRTW